MEEQWPRQELSDDAGADEIRGPDILGAWPSANLPRPNSPDIPLSQQWVTLVRQIHHLSPIVSHNTGSLRFDTGQSNLLIQQLMRTACYRDSAHHLPELPASLTQVLRHGELHDGNL